LVGNGALVKRIEVERYIDEKRGLPTLRDIIAELEKPGRDPRAEFEDAGFNPEITEFDQVKEEMIFNGVVTNVTQFGVFVDIGVHQDGLVHVSELAHRFVKDPAEVVRVGERVKVKVIQVDSARKRIGLSIKQLSAPPTGAAGGASTRSAPRVNRPDKVPERPGRMGNDSREKAPLNNPFAQALAGLKVKK